MGSLKQLRKSKKARQEYFANERFIHDELVRRAARIVEALPRRVKEDGEVKDQVFIWPSKPITLADGEEHDGVLLGGLDPDQDLAQLGREYHAYGILVVRQRGSEVKSTLETPHGTRTWTQKLNLRGDIRVLSFPIAQDDVDALGAVARSR